MKGKHRDQTVLLGGLQSDCQEAFSEWKRFQRVYKRNKIHKNKGTGKGGIINRSRSGRSKGVQCVLERIRFYIRGGNLLLWEGDWQAEKR